MQSRDVALLPQGLGHPFGRTATLLESDRLCLLSSRHYLPKGRTTALVVTATNCPTSRDLREGCQGACARKETAATSGVRPPLLAPAAGKAVRRHGGRVRLIVRAHVPAHVRKETSVSSGSTQESEPTHPMPGEKPVMLSTLTSPHLSMCGKT